MLAGSRPSRVPAALWALEPKLDGWRALVYVEDSQIDVRTRNGRAIADKVSELADLWAQIGRRCVLDGRVCSTASLSLALASIATERCQWTGSRAVGGRDSTVCRVVR
jgi:ATP-dependent DNA ligase